MSQAYTHLVFRTTLLSPYYCMLPLLGAALQTLATETDLGYLRRAGKFGYQVGLPAVAELCQQAVHVNVYTPYNQLNVQ